MANFAGTCTSDNKGLLLLLLHNRRRYNRTILKSKKSFCDNDNCLRCFSVNYGSVY